ncbi:hypothetical protein GXN76_00975 [Kroppenstedtia pulmonis]|uniref:Uncharacterized protein n=1 Tax=Kroppenstedtia pulmonis TaxID=1380685 RepID=A0A7D4BE03_9BACL|nr:hypothetical protein [Kroppenstedtia pulmonis]QKG83172.1 hypothetical protein GXN76_00975 [Kroppenstedtia pulmonis]
MGYKQPLSILEIVKKNQAHSRDHYSILPITLEYENNLYYYIHYKVSDRYLVVRRDSQVPPLKEVEPVIFMAASFVSYSNAFHRYGDEWIKAKTIPIYERIQKLLDILDKGLYSRLTEEQRGWLYEFREAAQRIIDWQREIEDVVATGKKHMDKITDQIATVQDRERLDQLQRQLIKCGYEQNQIQLKTDQNRQRLITSIWRKIPLFHFRLWLTYFELKKKNQKMLDWSKMDPEEIQDTEIVKKRIEGEIDPDSYQALKEIKAATINPR